MFGSWVLEVAIGVIFVFLVVSTICAAIREGIEAYTKTRAAYLERGIREMLHDPHCEDLARKFYEHPLIYGLYAGEFIPSADAMKIRSFALGRGLPSYIPSQNFAAVMIDLAARGSVPSSDNETAAGDPGAVAANEPRALATSPITAQSLRTGIAEMENQQVARAILSALDLAQDDLNKTRLNLEAWYDAGMDRVSGWYKRSTQWIVFWLALAIAGVLNVDTIGIANFLYRNDTARHAVVAEAEATLEQARKDAALVQEKGSRTPTAPSGGAPIAETEIADASRAAMNEYAQARKKLDTLTLPIGWREGIHCSGKGIWWLSECVKQGSLPFLGWVMTALAATLGAPFWFDILNKVMVIRSTVKPYEKSKPEGSEDRQNPDQSLTLALRQVAATATATGMMAQAGGITAATSAQERDPEANIDGCEPGNGPMTEDAELPPGDGGVMR